jgi:hypothetical protein
VFDRKRADRVADLEDEVMELRAKLQAMTIDRDEWHKIADERAAAIARLVVNAPSIRT